MLSILAEPRLKSESVGTARWFAVQREVIYSKPLVKHCYDLWYAEMIRDISAAVPSLEGAQVLELGSGSSYLKKLLPSVTTSDVVPGIAERVIDARSLPFADASLDAILATHVFHHIPDVSHFLREAERVLKPGGVISLIEVSHTPFGRFFFKHFHPEPYDDRAPTWSFASTHSMTDANQALSWIVFQRDRVRFEAEFPSLRLQSTRLLPWLSYLLSGGVTMRSMVPAFLSPVICALDVLMRPLDTLFALHWHLTIRKST